MYAHIKASICQNLAFYVESSVCFIDGSCVSEKDTEKMSLEML